MDNFNEQLTFDFLFLKFKHLYLKQKVNNQIIIFVIKIINQSLIEPNAIPTAAIKSQNRTQSPEVGSGEKHDTKFIANLGEVGLFFVDLRKYGINMITGEITQNAIQEQVHRGKTSIKRNPPHTQKAKKRKEENA